ncbi:MAG: hypothetical protein HY851_03115 [candidate division Zixibacteria bacterium]|nr:hypothetical protein [candidate division Zixibacteria bacterium]
MKRSTYIVMAVMALLFAVSWYFKAATYHGNVMSPLVAGFMITLAAFLTLAIISFVYQDNPFYKFAEHLFVGISAAFWMCQSFWSTIVGNLIPRISTGLSKYFGQPYRDEPWNFVYWLPVILGILLLLRLSSKIGWVSRWALAFIVGTTAGLSFIRYLRSDFMEQISSTMVPLLAAGNSGESLLSNITLSATGPFVAMLTNWVIFLGVICGIVYFFFSKEHTGLFGRASRVGIWILMITFGAAFGYTVMGRITLLVGRLTFLYKDWLGLIS